MNRQALDRDFAGLVIACLLAVILLPVYVSVALVADWRAGT